jgi:hypothetical protein
MVGEAQSRDPEPTARRSQQKPHNHPFRCFLGALCNLCVVPGVPGTYPGRSVNCVMIADTPDGFDFRVFEVA